MHHSISTTKPNQTLSLTNLHPKNTPKENHHPMASSLIIFLQLTLFVAIFFSSLIESESQIRKLDETPPLENKCGNCPCDNPCNPPASPPPSSPPPPSPPPPSPPPPSPPPPSLPKNPPASSNCPPPPSQPSPSGDKPPNTPYVYVSGPPGSVYSVYPYYSGGPRSFSLGIITSFLISGGIVWVLSF